MLSKLFGYKNLTANRIKLIAFFLHQRRTPFTRKHIENILKFDLKRHIPDLLECGMLVRFFKRNVGHEGVTYYYYLNRDFELTPELKALFKKAAKGMGINREFYEKVFEKSKFALLGGEFIGSHGFDVVVCGDYDKDELSKISFRGPKIMELTEKELIMKYLKLDRVLGAMLEEGVIIKSHPYIQC